MLKLYHEGLMFVRSPALVGLLVIVCSACITTDPHTPAQYEPETSEGNECRNQCLENFHRCVASFDTEANMIEACHGTYRGGIHLDQCFQNCEKFHGGEYVPFEGSETTSRSFLQSPESADDSDGE